MPTTHQTSRRQFLQGITAASAASILIRPAERAFGYQSANERPVFATIGLRNQGWEITGKSFRFADFAALTEERVADAQGPPRGKSLAHLML